MEMLAPYTTLGLGGPASDFAEADSAEHLVSLVAAADRESRPTLILGGGSNLVVADEGFDGLVIRVANLDVSVSRDGDQVLSARAAGRVGARG